MPLLENVLETFKRATQADLSNPEKRWVHSHASIVNDAGAMVHVGQFGEMWATDLHNDVLVQFQYNLSSYDVASELTTTGTVTQDDHMAVVSTGTASDGHSELYSLDSLRYRPGHSAVIQFTAAFTTGVANSKQRIGAFDDIDGAFVGFIGDTFSVGFLKDGVETSVPIGNFNGRDISAIDLTKLNIFRISFGWLGIAPIIFEVFYPDSNRFVPIHSIQLQGQQASPHIGNPSMPIHMDVENTGNTTDIVMKSASWCAGVMGQDFKNGGRPFQFSTTTASVGTTETVVAVFENQTMFQSKTNKVPAKLMRYQFFVDPPSSSSNYGTMQFRIVTNPTMTGTPTWTNIDATNSVMRYNTNQSYTAGTGLQGLIDWVGYAGGRGNVVPSSALDADQLGFKIPPGATYVILAQVVGASSSGTPDVRVSFNWQELF